MPSQITQATTFGRLRFGHSTKQRVIFIYHIQRRDRIRIIGARKAMTRERKQYEESISEEKE
jgi:uncharacterized DUF497 family protein